MLTTETRRDNAYDIAEYWYNCRDAQNMLAVFKSRELADDDNGSCDALDALEGICERELEEAWLESGLDYDDLRDLAPCHQDVAFAYLAGISIAEYELREKARIAAYRSEREQLA